MPPCTHAELHLNPSPNGDFVGYKQPTQQQRRLARKPATSKDLQRQHGLLDHASGSHETNPNVYPAPLVLPHDDLGYDPDYEPQTLQDCQRTVRKILSPQRRTVYVARPPSISTDLAAAEGWTQPTPPKPKSRSKKNPAEPEAIPPPDFDQILEYLKAFYFPFTVKPLPLDLEFLPWTDSGPPSATAPLPRYIALRTGDHATRIRLRAPGDGLLPAQLNLNDLLDAAISVLPRDAYALLFVVAHDLYESAADDFCCGRAYGGSHVAVVSSARYDPRLDAAQGVERAHAWPASHCARYVREACGVEEDGGKGKKKRRRNEAGEGDGSAMREAVKAFAALPEPKTTEGLGLLWLGRVCKTAAHELGHCLGMDHCVFYACMMQGTAGLTEDARQPPYLCPVDLAKLVTATGMWTTEHHEKLLAFCERYDGKDRLFSAFAAWLRCRLVLEV